MASKKNLKIWITADNSGLVKGLDESTRRIKSFDQQVGVAIGSTIARFASLTTVVTAAAGIIKDTTETIANFERKNSELAAVLGTNKQGIEGLAEAAKNLGRTTEFTSSEVTELQVALARLGFNSSQIEDMEGSVLKFAAAVGTDLGSAADFAGSALRAFGLESRDTSRLLDTMAAATSKSALDFSKLQTSIAIVAPIAHSFGLTAEETVAFLGSLANAGFDASMAATALRNILLNLADSNGKLAKGIGHSAQTFPEIISAFRELTASGVDLGEALDMTDVRSVSAFSTFLAGVDDIEALKLELDEANGSVDQMYKTMTDNLIGAVKQLQSAWEGLQLAMDGGRGILQGIVLDLADLLNAVTDVITSDFWDNKFWQKWGDGIRLECRLLMDKLMPVLGVLKDIKAAAEFFGAGGDTSGGVSASGGAGYQGGGSGGGGRGGSETTTTPQLTEQELKALEAAKAKAFREELAEIREVTAALREEEEEYARLAAEAIASWEAQHGIIHDTLDPITRDLINFVDAQQLYNDQMETFLSTMDEYFQKINEADLSNALAYVDMQLNDITDTLSNDLAGAIVNIAPLLNELTSSSAEAIGGLVGDLLTGGDAWNNFANTALTALGNMAVQVGQIAIKTGIGMIGIEKAINFGGPYAAIAAGAALVALGSAVKAGLGNIASGGYSASAGIASSSTASGYSNDFSTRDIHIDVTGTLKGEGSQLVGVINQVNKKNKLTT